MEGFDDSPTPVISEEVAEPLQDPILKRLKNHQFLRAAMRCNKGTRLRRRFAVNPCVDVPGVDTPMLIHNRAQCTKDSSVVAFTSFQDVVDSLKEKNVQKQVKDRIAFRANFDKMNDSIRWLKHKPDRSKLEDVCLKRAIVYELKDKFFDYGNGRSYKHGYTFMLENAQVDDKFVSPETIALHVIDEYLMKNDVDLLIFLNSLKLSQTGLMKFPAFASALERLNIPLETFEILEGVIALDCYDEDRVDVMAFCERMMDFRKYKWNRILTNRKKLCTDLITNIEGTEPRNILASPYKFHDAERKRLRPQANSAYLDLEIASSLKKFLSKKFQPQIPICIPKRRSPKLINPPITRSFAKKEQQNEAKDSQELINNPVNTTTSRYLDIQSKSVENVEMIRKKRLFWPGCLDKVLPVYMPGDGSCTDGKYSEGKSHPLFHIIRPESSVTKQSIKVPPFTRYRIYGYDGEI